jgi:hypothetical protein
MSLPGYDAWKTSSPDDEYIPADERPEGCKCHKRFADNEWCPVHGRDPDAALDEWRERQRDR